MKKTLALFIALLYLAVSSGLALEIHHCMGEVAAVSVIPSEKENDNCGSCGMPKDSNSCCKDELKIVKLQDAYKLLNVNYQLQAAQSVISQHFLFSNIGTPTRAVIQPGYHAPPPGSLTPPLYLFNCNFRI